MTDEEIAHAAARAHFVRAADERHAAHLKRKPPRAEAEAPKNGGSEILRTINTPNAPGGSKNGGRCI